MWMQTESDTKFEGKQIMEQRNLVTKIRKYIKEENTMEVNRHYCYYRANLVEMGITINEKLFHDINHQYMKYFNEQYLNGKKGVPLW